MPKYRVTLDGRTFELTGDHPPTEAEARDAIGVHLQPPAEPPDDRSYLEQVKDRFTSGLGRAVKNPAVGAGLAAAVAAPFTAGMSIPAAMGAMGAAGAGGSMLTGARDVPTIAKEGALAVAGEGGGRMLAGGLRMAGKGLYRAAALPLNAITKYGDLIQEGVEKAVPVSKRGLAKAEGNLAAAGAKKAAALTEADTRIGFRPKGITADAGANLQREASALRKAGLDDPSPMFERRLAGFEEANAPGMTASELEQTKHTLDNTVGGAYKKLRMKEALTPDERYGVEMTQAQSRALEEAIPNYRALNKEKMTAEGLRRMVARRVNPGSGSNQGLENAMTMLGGLHAIPARLAMLPPVLSRLGIGTFKTGQSAVPSAAFRTALLAMLGQGPDQP